MVATTSSSRAARDAPARPRWASLVTPQMTNPMPTMLAALLIPSVPTTRRSKKPELATSGSDRALTDTHHGSAADVPVACLGRGEAVRPAGQVRPQDYPASAGHDFGDGHEDQCCGPGLDRGDVVSHAKTLDGGAATVIGVQLEGEPCAYAEDPEGGGDKAGFRYRDSVAASANSREQCAEPTNKSTEQAATDYKDEVVAPGGNGLQVAVRRICDEDDRQEHGMEREPPASHLEEHQANKEDVEGVVS